MDHQITKIDTESPSVLKGQSEVWRYMFGFADSMALKCAVELRIADIIHANGGAVTLSQIAANIDCSSPDVSYLARIMRFLVRRNVFTMRDASNDGEDQEEPLYEINDTSKWLLHDADLSLAPIVLMQNNPLQMAPWHYLSRCVKEGGIAFEKAHGRQIWDFAAHNSNFNKLFNDAMACTAKVVTRAILSGYKQGFSNLGSLVDVGGGTGNLMAEIVKAHPHIKGINFDLPHVVAAAPPHQGVTHIEGDMFKIVPNADAVILKFIMHDWSDEDCIKILKNCKDAIPETGKIMIVDVVLKPNGNDMFNDEGFILDLVMIAHTTGGKERTEVEWKKLLEKGGFPKYQIINIPAVLSLIEAYPK